MIILYAIAKKMNVPPFALMAAGAVELIWKPEFTRVSVYLEIFNHNVKK